MWYGLTGKEAEQRCKAMALECRFTATADPRAEAVTAADYPGMKVIRAIEADDTITFLMGRFAEERRIHTVRE